MSPYQELCFLLREYDTAAQANDIDAVLSIATRIINAASALGTEAIINAERQSQARQQHLKLTLQ
jgi:hypothetical protein